MSFFLSQILVAAECKLQANCHCRVAGTTERWEQAYCLYSLGTNDPKDEKVKKCFAQNRGKAAGDSCQQNEHWKVEICKVFHKNNSEKAERCNRKPFVPKVVAEGL